MTKRKPKKAQQPPKPVGRPTEYDPAFCQQLIDHMRGGGSFVAFGAKVLKSKETLYEWVERHPEFADSKKLGEVLSLQFWEELGKSGNAGQLRTTEEEIVVQKNGTERLTRKKRKSATFGGSTWQFIMRNRFPDLYREQHDLNVKGLGEDLTQLTEQQGRERLQALRDKVKKALKL